MASDEALLERLRGGDLKAFDALYARYEAHLYGFIRAQVRDHAAAEDLMHETFMTVLRTRVAPTNLRSWLFQVARNACLNRARSARRAAAAHELGATSELPAPADAELERFQRGQALDAAVQRLPSELGQLYHLRARGLSYLELAEVLSIPLGTVKSRLHDLVRRLKQELAS